MEITIHGMSKVALGVLIALLGMSVLSIGIMAERWWAFRQAVQLSRRFAAECAALLRQGRLADAVAAGRGKAMRQSHVAAVTAAGVQEWLEQTGRGTDPDLAALATKDALRHTSEMRLAELKRGLSVLATIGSTAPFVGLFGTTIGIIEAFAGIAITGAGGITVITAGISEALVTTAFGLFVAIPAVWGYNYFLGRVESASVEIDRSSYQLVDYLVKRA
jgi:biopolymer transport protein ExbB/TolQ